MLAAITPSLADERDEANDLPAVWHKLHGRSQGWQSSANHVYPVLQSKTIIASKTRAQSTRNSPPQRRAGPVVISQRASHASAASPRSVLIPYLQTQRCQPASAPDNRPGLDNFSQGALGALFSSRLFEKPSRAP